MNFRTGNHPPPDSCPPENHESPLDRNTVGITCFPGTETSKFTKRNIRDIDHRPQVGLACPCLDGAPSGRFWVKPVCLTHRPDCHSRPVRVRWGWAQQLGPLEPQLERKSLVLFCTEAWPQCPLGDREPWPPEGILNYRTIQQPDTFCRWGRWEEAPCVRLFFRLRERVEWQRAASWTPGPSAAFCSEPDPTPEQKAY